MTLQRYINREMSSPLLSPLCLLSSFGINYYRKRILLVINRIYQRIIFFHRIHSFHIKPIKSPTGNYHFFAKILIIINLISVKSSNIYKEEFKSILFNKCVKHYIIQLFISLSVSLFIGSFLYCNGDFPNDFLKHLLK